MPPKKILRNVDKKMPVLQDLNEEAELKFDMEVFWCISQLEADVNSGKLPEKKRNELINVISALRNPSVNRMQKITHMQKHVKDYKSKMAKDLSDPKIQFACDNSEAEPNKAIYLKKKATSTSREAPNQFLFNFEDPCTPEIGKIDLNKE